MYSANSSNMMKTITPLNCPDRLKSIRLIVQLTDNVAILNRPRHAMNIKNYYNAKDLFYKNPVDVPCGTAYAPGPASLPTFSSNLGIISPNRVHGPATLQPKSAQQVTQHTVNKHGTCE